MADKVPIVPVGTRKDGKVYLQLIQESYNKEKLVNQLTYYAKGRGEDLIEVKIDNLSNIKPGEYGWFQVVL